MSGLKVNQNKSTVILSKAVRNERQEILDVLGFQEAALPIKYLGVPLTASRLTVADCQPLIDRFSSRISGWNHLALSFAGRTQVLKSVLSALHMYWASVFILRRLLLSKISVNLGGLGAPISSAKSGYLDVLGHICALVLEEIA
ncbi:UNVERIFIED_CONTAM: hypothetical protein Sradi_7181200 [Sesamum radiatum]|uniref:Reverse transcriptase n=1 Tax=Sesamum radiatum TaxID=300843 RepID=A0AAW2ISW3_SESRA